MRQEVINIYSFDELSDEAKQSVLEKNVYINVEHNRWWDYIEDEFKLEVKKQGFDVKQIYFSGFGSQGDGSMFEGRVNSNFKFERIRPLVQNLINKGLIDITSIFKHHGHYYHHRSYSNEFDVDFIGICEKRRLENYLYQDCLLEEQITNKYESICQELYKKLEDAYESLTSKDLIIETINANNYEFYESGRMV